MTGLNKANDYKCPICKAPFKNAQGIQPKGTMSVREDPYTKLPGFEKDPQCRGAIIITYYFASGTQGVPLFSKLFYSCTVSCTMLP